MGSAGSDSHRNHLRELSATGAQLTAVSQAIGAQKRGEASSRDQQYFVERLQPLDTRVRFEGVTSENLHRVTVNFPVREDEQEP
ncbi:hypothetical protein ACOMHN_002922 [Nucella lapillus]